MNIRKCLYDQMTPVERKHAMEQGTEYDRLPAIPFIGNMRLLLCNANESDYWKSPKLMAQGEVSAYERFGLDRLFLGPNTKGISAALSKQLPSVDENESVLQDYSNLYSMEPIEANCDSEIRKFLQAAEMLTEMAGEVVPIEISIGGPFTIASFLRGIERLLRDCRKYPEDIHYMMRLVVESQKSVIDAVKSYGVGIAMADPVANPALIGPKLYEKLVFPYTLELTNYAYEQTGNKASLHMCGETYSIWKFIKQYELSEISLDNIVDLEKAVRELGGDVPVAGNVDPVQIMMNGTQDDIFDDVKRCMYCGKKSQKGFHLTTGCDIPDGTAMEKVEWFMEAARLYGKNSSVAN